MRDLTPAEQLVDEVLAEQRAKGRAKYGQGLDAHDGHDWTMEALQELVDATQYLVAEVAKMRALLSKASREHERTRRLLLKAGARTQAEREHGTRLRDALTEALDGWADAAQYKGDHLREKHGDAEDIARLRALLTKEARHA